MAVLRCRQAGITDPEEILYLFTGFQAAFTMVLRRWVDQDCRQPDGQMAALLVSTLPAAWRV